MTGKYVVTAAALMLIEILRDIPSRRKHDELAKRLGFYKVEEKSKTRKSVDVQHKIQSLDVGHSHCKSPT